MSRRLALCFLLLLASTSVSARDYRMAGPNGGGGSGTGSCSEATADDTSDVTNAMADATKKPAAKPQVTATTTRKPVKVTPAARAEADSASRLTAPRWHSFLPGMFR
ncbi:hypothetical protein LVB87_02990 [Lysobacter sp. KIS68-7]|uniref:hypothetical protein n=1 Tax=Lysobacter sp. KIS68-7 TaxID=2904252 RepID=UPI001E6337F5|nr:hypothetical protein [Lysobacter sp. KIS68-7]UHQ20141.1 hypothetical protein LVB87_02990 [Lysobacter sp. KIS68-7]